MIKEFSIATAILRQHQEVANQIYAEEDKGVAVDLFTGESALHIAITHKNLEMVEELLALNRDLLWRRATGLFNTDSPFKE